MKYVMGVTRRAVWKPLEETFIVISRDEGGEIVLGGFEAEGRKIRVVLDLDDVRKLAEVCRIVLERRG